MKSNSDVKPPKFLDLGDGSWHYNYNVKEVEVESEDGTTKTIYEYDTVHIWGNPAYMKLVRIVIAESFSIEDEIELVRNYNAFVLKYSNDANDKLCYLDYMKKVQEIKDMVKQDLIDSGFTVDEPVKEIFPFPNFSEIDSNAPVEAGEQIVKDGKTYRAIFTHWKYQVTDDNFASFYKEVITGESGIPEWVQPTGAHDAYSKGDKVIFEGKTYESVIDSNVYSPIAYPAGWKELV